MQSFFTTENSCHFVNRMLKGNPIALKALIAQGADIHSCGSALMMNADRSRLNDQETYYA